MPSNSKEYQRSYRTKNGHKRKVVSVAMSHDDHRDIARFAKDQGLSLSAILREATLHQYRNRQLHDPSVAEDLKELRFLLSNFANNMNQTAHHSNRLKQVIDENGVLQRFAELDQMLCEFIETRSKPAL
jgi:hypothetical protein